MSKYIIAFTAILFIILYVLFIHRAERNAVASTPSLSILSRGA